MAALSKKRKSIKRIHRRGSLQKRVTRKKPQDHTEWIQRLNEQAAASFNQGFDAGYDDALLKMGQTVPVDTRMNSCELTYSNGVYDGGEAIVDSILPELDILPDISLQQIILAGMEQLRPKLHKLLSAAEVTQQLIDAMNKRTPLSVVRLGDGELLTLAQEVVMSEEQVRQKGHFLSYAGIHLPDLVARDQLVQAIRKADIVGIPKLRLPNFQTLAFSVFKAHGIDYQQLRLTLSTINYAIYVEGLFRNILSNRRVLVVGNTSHGLSQVLSNSGIHVAGAIYPVEGMRDVTRVISEVAVHDFDIALVGAGVPAVVIVQRIASELGKVAIDFGHLADSLVNGEAVL